MLKWEAIEKFLYGLLIINGVHNYIIEYYEKSVKKNVLNFMIAITGLKKEKTNVCRDI